MGKVIQYGGWAVALALFLYSAFLTSQLTKSRDALSTVDHTGVMKEPAIERAPAHVMLEEKLRETEAKLTEANALLAEASQADSPVLMEEAPEVPEAVSDDGNDDEEANDAEPSQQERIAQAQAGAMVDMIYGDLFAELGLTPVVACELEFYLIDPERGPMHEPQPPTLPKSGKVSSGTQVYSIYEMDEFADVLYDIADACRVQEIPAGPASAEYATGQFEINLNHVDDPLAACDHSALLQRVIRGVARKHGFEATFMAKPYPDGTGSGLHVHCSLLDKDGNNVFDDGTDAGGPMLRHAIGGMLATMMEGMAIFAPNRNSYRRFVYNSFVPLRAAWSYNNRSTALRIPAGDGASRRFEHRISGADANPYLTLAAILAGMHHGIVNQIEPEPAVEGNAGEIVDPDMPRTWQRALDRAGRAEVLNHYFGDEYWRRYLQCKQNELDRFSSMISPLEYDWYLLCG